MTGLMKRAVWETYLDGYRAGYIDGTARGRQLADDEAQALHRPAHKIVTAMAKIDPHVEREQRRRQHQLEAAARAAAAARPWPAEAAPIRQPQPDFTGCAGRCRRPGAEGHEVCARAQGWPLEVVLTPAEAAYAAGQQVAS